MPLEEIAAGLGETRAAFGRGESVRITVPSADRAAPTRELRIMLVKNPAGANEVLRTLASEPGEHELLGVLNDRIADGRDVSWIWDADFELLAGRDEDDDTPLDAAQLARIVETARAAAAVTD